MKADKSTRLKDASVILDVCDLGVLVGGLINHLGVEHEETRI